jgi:hypothetical protein
VTRAQATAGAKAQRKSINTTNFGAGAMQQASREYGVDLWQKLTAWTRRLNRYLNQARQGHFPAAVQFCCEAGWGFAPVPAACISCLKNGPQSIPGFLAVANRIIEPVVEGLSIHRFLSLILAKRV